MAGQLQTALSHRRENSNMVAEKQEGIMTPKERQMAVAAMVEAILAALYATMPEEDDEFRNSQTFAEAALAGLEAAGFTLIRDADRT